MIAQFREAGVEVRGVPRTMELAGGQEVFPASEEDWKKEYSDLIISIKIVDGVNEAIEHINRYGSRHTESIVTESHDVAARFMEFVDAAAFFKMRPRDFPTVSDTAWARKSASARKTSRARPCGPRGLTTYKYKLFGEGQTVASL